MQCSRCGGVYSNVSLFHLLNMLLQMRQIKVLLVEEFKSGFPKLRKAGKEEESHRRIVCSSPTLPSNLHSLSFTIYSAAVNFTVRANIMNMLA